MKIKKEIKRIRTNITLPPALFQKVKDYDLNLSAFLQKN
jgi:post-segregation antitoxin (ccd killing protein)